MDRERNRTNVQRHREQQRDRGLRPVQFWVPDTQSPEFLAEAERQCRLVNQSPQAAEDARFLADLRAATWDIADADW